MKNKPLLIILAAALVLRVVYLAAAPLWYDEAFTAWVSSMSFSSMWAAVLGDVHPPLYYLITWAALHVTGAETPAAMAWVLRAFSVPFSLWAVYLTYRIGESLKWSQRATLAAAAFMAVSPIQIFFAQEARMYAMFQAVILLAFLGWLNCRYGLVFAGLLSGLCLHNYGLIYLGTFAVILLLFYWRSFKRFGKLTTIRRQYIYTEIAAILGPLVLWLPWAWVLYSQMGTVAGGYWIMPPTAGDILSAYYYILAGIVQRPEFHAVGVMVVFGASILAAVRVFQKRPTNWVYLAIFALLPLAVAVIGSYLWQPVLLYRGLLPSSAALALLIGWALTRGPVRYQIIAAALIAPVILVSLVTQYTANPKASNNDVAELTERIRENWQPGDIIYHIDAGSMVGWWVYAPDLPQYKAPSCEDETLGSLSPATRAGLGIIEAPLSEIEHRRAWVIYAVGPTARACMVRDYGMIEYKTPFALVEDSEYVKSGVWLVGAE